MSMQIKTKHYLLLSFVGLYACHASLFLTINAYHNWFLSYGETWPSLLSRAIWIGWVATLSFCLLALPLLLLKFLFDAISS